MPLGYFLTGDYKEVGGLVMERCVEMDRPTHLVACPIMAENDAWGVAVFKLKRSQSPISGVLYMPLSPINYLTLFTTIMISVFVQSFSASSPQSAVKRLIVELLEALAAKTENTLDDVAVAQVRKALLG